MKQETLSFIKSVKFTKMKSALSDENLKSHIQKADMIKIPESEEFYEKLTAKIMAGIEKTDVKPLSRWAKTWVFLDSKSSKYRRMPKALI